MSRYVDISPELLLSMCQEGARFVTSDRTVVCVRGVSAQATVTGVEVVPSLYGHALVRVHFNDPDAPDGNEPSLWKVETRETP